MIDHVIYNALSSVKYFKESFLFFSMKKLIIAILLAVSILIGVGLILGVFQGEKPIPLQKIPFDFKLGDYVGINADPDAFHFGTIKPGGSSKRIFNFSNTYPFALSGDVIILINESTGPGEDIGSWFYIDPNPFILLPNTTQSFNILLTVPRNATYLNYSGYVLFNLTRATEDEILLLSLKNDSLNLTETLDTNVSVDVEHKALTVEDGGDLTVEDGGDLTVEDGTLDMGDKTQNAGSETVDLQNSSADSLS